MLADSLIMMPRCSGKTGPSRPNEELVALREMVSLFLPESYRYSYCARLRCYATAGGVAHVREAQ